MYIIRSRRLILLDSVIKILLKIFCVSKNSMPTYAWKPMLPVFGRLESSFRAQGHLLLSTAQGTKPFTRAMSWVFNPIRTGQIVASVWNMCEAVLVLGRSNITWTSCLFVRLHFIQGSKAPNIMTITHVKYIFCEVNKVMNKLNSESKPSFEYRNRFQEPSRNRVCNWVAHFQ